MLTKALEVGIAQLKAETALSKTSGAGLDEQVAKKIIL